MALDYEIRFCGSIVRRRSGWLSSELRGIKRHLSEKRIHDCRVQSRRLRAALEAFRDRFPARRWRSIYTHVRELTRLLGRTRELDVNLVLLRDLTRSGDMAENLCREYLEERFQRRRQRRYARLKERLNAYSPLGLTEQVQSLLAQIIPNDNSPSRPRGGSPVLIDLPAGFDTRLRPRAQRVLSDLAAPLFAHRPSRFRRAGDRTLHDVRISAKKLRYAMEIFAARSGGGLADAITRTRALQDAGGHYQDWCVLRQYVRREISRLSRYNTTHMAFQMRRLLAQIEEERSFLRGAILPALVDLQETLRGLVRSESQPEVPRVPRARIRNSARPRSQSEP